ncbi:MAG: LolA family protein, partial [Armatimonadota bacterium]
MKLPKMNIFAFVSVCMLVLSSPASMPATAGRQPNLSAKEIVAKVAEQFDLIKDYTVDIKAVVDGPTIHIPDMRARLYYKQPNKLKVGSEDGFAVVPKQGLMMENAIRDMISASDLNLVGEARINGSGCYVIKVTLKKDRQSTQSVIWVDKKYWLVRRIHNNPDFGDMTKIKIWYTRV